jgi:hypothetical protein
MCISFPHSVTGRWTEDVQELKAKLAARSPKTVNNVLTTLSVLLKTAVDWGAIERLGCSIKLLRTPKSASSFYDFEEYERLVEISRTDAATHLAVLLEARLGCAAARSWRWRWTDIDLTKRQLCVARSEVEGPRDDAQGWSTEVRADDETVD